MNKDVFWEVITERICVPRPLFLLTDWFEPFVPRMRIRYLIEGNIFFLYNRRRDIFLNIEIFDVNGKWNDDHNRDSRQFRVAFRHNGKITNFDFWLCVRMNGDETLRNIHHLQLYTHRCCPAIAYSYEPWYSFNQIGTFV